MDNYFIKIKGLKNTEKVLKFLKENNINASMPDFAYYSKEDYERGDIIILQN